MFFLTIYFYILHILYNDIILFQQKFYAEMSFWKSKFHINSQKYNKIDINKI